MLFPHATKYMDFLTTSFLVHCHQLDVQQFNSILALNYLESVQTAEGLNAGDSPHFRCQSGVLGYLHF